MRLRRKQLACTEAGTDFRQGKLAIEVNSLPGFGQALQQDAHIA
jgi:hypothetical protein